MDIDGFVIPVPAENRQASIDHATNADSLFMELGALRVVECWGDDVPGGKLTDFCRAVDATARETVCFSWVEWPDKPTRDAAFATMMSEDFDDPRIDQARNAMPFDGKRMIFGGFVPVVAMGDET